jgi:hypothetical protein
MEPPPAVGDPSEDSRPSSPAAGRPPRPEAAAAAATAAMQAAQALAPPVPGLGGAGQGPYERTQQWLHLQLWRERQAGPGASLYGRSPVPGESSSSGFDSDDGGARAAARGGWGGA